MDPAWGDRRNVLGPGCWLSPAEEREFLHKRLTVLLGREAVVVGSPWSMDCHLWERWASQTQRSSIECTFPGVLRSRCFWLVLSNPARLTWYCWQASYLICGENEPTLSILPFFFFFFQIKKFWLFAMFLGRDVCKISCLPAVHPALPNVPNWFTFFFPHFRVVFWLSLEHLSGFLFALNRESLLLFFV